jgi:hypothetical protein
MRPVRERTDADPVPRPPSLSDWAITMVVFAIVAVGLLGGGFMLYVLFQWTRETVRNRNQ